MYWDLYLEKSPPGRRKEQLMLFIRKTYKKAKIKKGQNFNYKYRRENEGKMKCK
jgi:hypothetical protein